MAMGRRLSYWNPRLLRTLFLQLQQQQQEGLFCDVTLQGDAEGDGLHVHSCVIAACSPYLAQLLRCTVKMSDVIFDSEGPVLRNRRILHVSGIPNHHLLPLVRYMYTSELEVAPADAYGVLQTAQKLRIPVLENLKLEGGRIVRPETGRKINRGCLGSGKQTYVVNGLQHSEREWINDELYEHEDKKPFLHCSVNNDSHSPNMLENISFSHSLAKTIPSEQNLLESAGKDKPHIKVTLKRLYNSTEELPNQNIPHIVSEQNKSNHESVMDLVKSDGGEQNKSSQESLMDLVKSDGGEKQERHDTPKNGNPKRRKLNRVAKLDISPDTAVSISHSGKLKDKMINVSKTENMGKRTCANLTSTFMVKDDSQYIDLSNVQHDISCMDEDSKIKIKESKSAEHLTRGQLYNTFQKGEEAGESEGSLAFIGMDNKKDADKDEYFGIADPTVSYSSTSSSLEVLSKAELDLTEIQKDTVARKDLMHADSSNSEASMTCLHSSTADESGKIQIDTNVPSVHEVEKVKLRKIKNGPSWEIVKDVYLDAVSDNENPEHVNELEEFLEQMLNLPSSASDVDVGGCSPAVWIGECVWPDPPSESDEEIDVLH